MGGAGTTDDHLDEDAIFGLAEGGLEASVRAAAEAHLQGCAVCRREVEIAAGYFKEIAGLEPVMAPANFLANVRARLPRPSPLRAFLDVFMRPLRVIPMQVALLTILGLTAISSYLYQRGGLNQGPAGVLTETAAESVAETASESAVDADTETPPEAISEVASEKPDPRGGPPNAPSKSIDPLKKLSQAPRPMQKRARSEAMAKQESESRSDESPSESDQLYESDHDVPASAPASPQATDPAPISPSRQAAPSAPTVAAVPAPLAEPARAEKPRAATEAAKEAAKEKKAAGKGWSGDKAMSDSKDMDEDPATRVPGNAGGIGSAELPAFIVRLAPGKRIGDAVSGLKAMGADSLSARSARTAVDSGGKGMDYLFQVPASMRKDIAPYLERYGRVEGSGLLPAAGSAPSRIRIRFLP